MTTQNHPGLRLADYQIAEDVVHDSRPTVGVIISSWYPGMNYAGAQMMQDVLSVGIQAVRNAGGRPVLIDSADEAMHVQGTQWHAEMDAFVYLGGADIHPGFFSAVDLSKPLAGVDSKADQFCLDSIQRAVAEDYPVLGICRGSQLLNVAMGGSIIQHIDDHREIVDAVGNIAFINEEITVEPNSKIGELLGRRNATVRGAHHQAVDRIGEGLRATAYAHDRMIEATEHVDKTWVIGVQWHPEEPSANEADRKSIFGSLVEHAKVCVSKVAEPA